MVHRKGNAPFAVFFALFYQINLVKQVVIFFVQCRPIIGVVRSGKSDEHRHVFKAVSHLLPIGKTIGVIPIFDDI